ncbi:endonuclease/exonuclease/phosphatase family protein [Demequina sp. NBRC 110053]|uniref:endonuclease/exonuclease/phosphatase family protein n=1 Tax=Demequina sp. NBRC 110053 TaxID=1570342 RepID=UPI0009FBB6D6|nr:endonuclease/exonuclease/phosphatase family protein [Demequina sp. NBRC 110053]
MTGRTADARAESPRPSPSHRTAGRRVATALGWLAIAPAAFAVVARAASLEAGPLALLVALAPWALLGAAVAVVLAVVGRSAVLAAAAVIVAMPVVLWNAPLWTSGAVPAGPRALTVATVSMTFGQADPHAVVALVRDHEVDVLAIQELTPEAAEALVAAGLEDELAHDAAYPEPGFTGTGLWSREPLLSETAVPGFVSRTIRAELDAVGGLTVVAPHPAAPGPWRHEGWSADTTALVSLLDGIDGPTLVVGDLNLTRDHRAFRDLLDQGLIDAVDQAGAGLPMTFPEQRTAFPFVAIDHVLARDVDFAATDVDTDVVAGSDHRALVVTYAYPGE